MIVRVTPADLLEELEQRQDEVLEQLEDLNRLVENVLAENIAQPQA